MCLAYVIRMLSEYQKFKLRATGVVPFLAARVLA
jgi:hypothetical protein